MGNVVMLDSDWWRAWGAELQDGQIPDATIDAMRSQPRLDAAIAQAMRDVLKLVDDDAQFHRATQDLESLILVTIVLYLDATGDLTHRRLRDVAGVRGMLSGSRISALLLRLQMIGFVRAEAGHAPGTAKVYRPTPRLIESYLGWLRAMLDAIEVMAPRPQVPANAGLASRLEDPEAFRAFMAIIGQRFMAGVTNPPLRPPGADLERYAAVAARRAGNVVIFTLLEAAAAAAGRDLAAGPASVSVSALARRGRVSRTQILKILRDAEDSRLFVRQAGEGEGEVMPALLDAVRDFYTSVFVHVAAAAHGGFRGRALTSPPIAASG